MKRVLMVIFVTILLLAVALYTVHQSPNSHHPGSDSVAMAPDTAMNMLYDANLSNFSLKPYFTYWVDGSTCKKLRPECRILRMEDIVEVKNETYLAFFDLENRSVKLVPANETQIKEYLQFFEEHGGRTFRCNSTVKGTVGNRTFLANNGICLAPAVVKVKG
ncbi:hypothetical protein [Thermococcus sp.]